VPEKLNLIDLFAGCGGLTDGFLQTGRYKTLAAVDWERPALETLKNRLKTKWNYKSDKIFVHFDLQRTEELINGFEDINYGKSEGLTKLVENNEVDIIVGGPPCQAYSIAGRVRDKDGMQSDYRNFLFESYINIVNQFKPKAFVFENVEGILSATPGGISIIDRIRKEFGEIGYEITDELKKNALFDISYFQVPQRRKRVIIFGVKKSDKSREIIEQFYSSIRDCSTDLPRIVKTAFEGLPKIYPSKSEEPTSHIVETDSQIQLKNHTPRKHNERDIKVFRLLADDIKSGREQYTSVKELVKLYERVTGKKSKFHKYHVIREDKPSNTIPAHLYKDGLRHIHPDPNQARSITVREAARIQGFDDDFEFLGSMGDQFKMIGNAVPPIFSKLIAETIIKLNL